MSITLGEHVVGLLALDGESIDPNGRSRIEVMPEGTFQHHTAGKMTITRRHLEQLAADINERGSSIPIDYDHSFAMGNGSRAAGWFIPETATIESASSGEGVSLYADVQWTPTAAAEIRDGEWKFISPEWNFTWKDNRGKQQQKPRLFAAALTNRPFFTQLGPVNLCDQGLAGLIANSDDPDNDGLGHAAASKKCSQCGADMPMDSEDSLCGACKSRMAHTTSGGLAAHTKEDTMSKLIAKALGLAEDADEATIASALESRLSAGPDATLVADALAGRQANERLNEMERDTLIASAIEKGKVAPAEREALVDLWAKSPDGVKAYLAAKPERSLVPVATPGTIAGGESDRPLALAKPATAGGALYGSNPPETLKQNGDVYDVDQDRAAVHKKALAVLAANGKGMNYTADEYLWAITAAAQDLGTELYTASEYGETLAV